MESTQKICSQYGLRYARATWLAVIFSGLSAFLPVQVRAGISVTTLFSFEGTNGGDPDAPLVQGPDGSLYGTTEGGFGLTSVFSLSPAGELKTLASFPEGFDVWGPFVLASDGAIYGTASFSPSTRGAIFRVSALGDLQVMFSFNGTNGDYPCGLMMGPDGGLYGVTRYGGSDSSDSQSSGSGTIFRLDTNGAFSTVFTFNGTNGLSPNRMILGRDGAFYGTTRLGGPSLTNFIYGYGTVFKFVPGGPLITLHSFNNTDGAGPLAIIQGADGDLYGIAQYGGASATSPFEGYGTVYRLTTNGVFTKLADCDSVTKLPLSIVQATDGTLYGSAGGGPQSAIFRVDPGGTLRVVWSLEMYSVPGFLVQMPGGSIYGTSRSGGAYQEGTIFRLDVTADPPLLRVASVQTNQVALTWNANLGSSYQVQGCGNLVQAGWTNIGGAFAATNSVVSVSSVGNPSLGCFYRVVLLP